MGDDYPAAHSMDTEWFAVDRYGFVAAFSSGEIGAVPNAAAADLDLVELLRAIHSPADPLYDLDVLTGPDPDPAGLHIGDPDPDLSAATPATTEITAASNFLGPFRATDLEVFRGRPILMFLPSLDPVRDEIDQRLAIPVPSRRTFAVLFDRLPLATYRRLHSDGACLGCFWDFEYEGRSLPNQFGLYTYRHLDTYGFPEPYRRFGSPLQLLHVDQLPPELRDRLMPTCFEAIGFEDAEFLQPLEHLPCATWRAFAYVTTGPRKLLRPIPAQEDQFREEYEQLAGVPDLEVEPLPPESPGSPTA